VSRLGVFKISGTQYDLDDLDLDEMEAIEELAGGVFNELNFGSSKVMKAIAYTLMRRTQPDLAYADVGKVKVIDFMAPDEEMPDLPPAEDGDSNPNGSEPEGSGVLLSAVSTPG
jgi:hypothetical protein